MHAIGSFILVALLASRLLYVSSIFLLDDMMAWDGTKVSGMSLLLKFCLQIKFGEELSAF